MNRHVPPDDIDSQDAASRPPPDFRAAARHSARVRWIKRLLPVGIIAAALAIGASALMSQLRLDVGLPVDIGRLSLSGSRLTMELPHLSGFTDDERGYSVTAQTASQDLKRPDYIDLSGITARMDLANKGWAEVQAKDGTVNIKTQIINLDRGIEVSMNGGYAGQLTDARIDVKQGSLITRKPVVFTYHDAKIVADSLTVTESGDMAVFDGNVQVDFLPAQLREAASGAGADAASSPPGSGALQPAGRLPSASPAPQAPGPQPSAPATDDAPQATPAPADQSAIDAVPEGPLPTAVVPLPLRKPAIQAAMLPEFPAPLPPPRPVPFP